MFGRLKERIAGNKRVSGLSRAMSIVDQFMVPGSTVKALDHGYGQAYVTIRQEYIEGKFDENEMKAALVTLDNQHDKLRRQAQIEEIIGNYA